MRRCELIINQSSPIAGHLWFLMFRYYKGCSYYHSVLVCVCISSCSLTKLFQNRIFLLFDNNLSVAFLKCYSTNLWAVINSKGTDRREREWHFTEEVTFELAPEGWVRLCQKRGGGGGALPAGKEVRAKAQARGSPHPGRGGLFPWRICHQKSSSFNYFRFGREEKSE